MLSRTARDTRRRRARPAYRSTRTPSRSSSSTCVLADAVAAGQSQQGRPLVRRVVVDVQVGTARAARGDSRGSRSAPAAPRRGRAPRTAGTRRRCRPRPRRRGTPGPSRGAASVHSGSPSKSKNRSPGRFRQRRQRGTVVGVGLDVGGDREGLARVLPDLQRGLRAQPCRGSAAACPSTPGRRARRAASMVRIPARSAGSAGSAASRRRAGGRGCASTSGRADVAPAAGQCTGGRPTRDRLRLRRGGSSSIQLRAGPAGPGRRGRCGQRVVRSASRRRGRGARTGATSEPEVGSGFRVRRELQQRLTFACRGQLGVVDGVRVARVA